ncbi:DUF485 domain-containing protein [Nocardia sp. NPDC051990]|uniref:DUF485 domain-containing protein n=1 Tax=Nocardia sp. NPDC051990 TaxID=3155285 RepID=UPI00343638D8
MLRLRRDRRDFFLLAWPIFALFFCALLGVTAFAPGVTAQRPVPGLSVGLILALSYVVVVMALSAWYVRRSRRWDVLAAEALTFAGGHDPIEETHHV